MSMTILQLNELSQAEFVRVVGPVFEQSPQIAELAWLKRPFRDADQLHTVLCDIVRAAGEPEKIGLIRAHPDLVGRATRTGRSIPELNGDLTTGQEPLTVTEIENFQKYNAEYRYKFGFPFVICARRNDKTAILTGFERRLKHTREQEVTAALEEIFQMARQRLEELAPGRVTAASLSTQVLDTTAGTPANGMTIELWSITDGTFTLVKTVKTHAEGRPAAPLLSTQEMKAGEYEVIYCFGDHFGTLGGKRFLDRVPVRFFIVDADASCHLTVQCSPWTYSVCRTG